MGAQAKRLCHSHEFFILFSTMCLYHCVLQSTTAWNKTSLSHGQTYLTSRRPTISHFGGYSWQELRFPGEEKRGG